jgi:small subunit ribosomal protein S17
MAGEIGRRKTLVGNVISDRMDKTIVVSVEKFRKHPLYGKYIKRKAKFFAHDEKDECSIGDKVLIEETRPMSRLKRWRVRGVLEKAS